MMSKRIILTMILFAAPQAHGMLSPFSTAVVGSSAQCASMHSMIWPFARFFGKKVTPTTIARSNAYQMANREGLLTRGSQLELENCRNAQCCKDVLRKEISRLIPTSRVAKDTELLEEEGRNIFAHSLATLIVTEAANPGWDVIPLNVAKMGSGIKMDYMLIKHWDAIPLNVAEMSSGIKMDYVLIKHLD